MRYSLGFILFFALFLLSEPRAASSQQDQRVPFRFLDDGVCREGHCRTEKRTPPANSRLVIETFSMSIRAAEGEVVGGVGLREVTDDGEQVTIHLAPVVGPFQIPNVTGVAEFIASQMVRVYPRPEFDVVLLCETTDENAEFTATISGYFLPLTSPTLSP
jgi:hypothetical protein